MNLKNSRFYKRIQNLRQMTKEKMRKERNRARLDCALENCIKEQDGGETNYETEDKSEITSAIKLRQQQLIAQQCDQIYLGDEANKNLTSYIHFNQSCYQIDGFSGVNLGKKDDLSISEDSLPSIKSTRGSICVTNSRYTHIGKIAKSLGYKVVKDNKMWNVLWLDSVPGVEVYKAMKRFQQVNHFPGMIEICRKDLLSRNLNRMQKLYPRDYKIFPKTWVFPADYGDAVSYAANHSKLKTFIIKPDAGAQGRGIWLTNDLKTINPTERMICQTYINKPLLIDGYKFDLRVYALITSVDPLRIFVYSEGLARFATSKYVEPTAHNNTDLYMHLTNYSVNRRNSQYDLCDNDDCGSKRKIGAINNWMHRRNYNVHEFWGKIDDIIIKTILSAWPVLKHNYHACFPSHDKIQACFEILGFDILVDSKMKPYVLEVNHSPSFHMNEAVDEEVKKPLIKDTLTLISTALADKKQIIREDRKRVKQRLLKVKQGSLTQRSHISNEAMATNAPGDSVDEKAAATKLKTNPLSPLAQQIAWEESHLGDFRRIMPPNDPAKLNYYCQFYGHQNRASIYADTAASKKREEVSKKLRMELEAKRLKQTEIVRRAPVVKFEEKRLKQSRIPRLILEKHRQQQLRQQAGWSPGFISTAEDRLRTSYMQMRSEILKDFKIPELIFSCMYSAGNLTNSDIQAFPEFYECLENRHNIIASLDA